MYLTIFEWEMCQLTNNAATKQFDHRQIVFVKLYDVYYFVLVAWYTTLYLRVKLHYLHSLWIKYQRVWCQFQALCLDTWHRFAQWLRKKCQGERRLQKFLGHQTTFCLNWIRPTPPKILFLFWMNSAFTTMMNHN